MATPGSLGAPPRLPDYDGHRSSPNFTNTSFQTTKNGRVLVLKQTNDSRPSSAHSSVSGASDGNGSNFGSRGRRPSHDICVGEELRIAVELVLERFRRTEDYEEVEFPSSLTAMERAYVHRLASTFGLKSKSHGKGPARHLSVTKKTGNCNASVVANLKLMRDSQQCISVLVQKFPLTNKEQQDLLPRKDKVADVEGLRDFLKTTTGRLSNSLLQVPPRKSENFLSSFRQTLPIATFESEILKAVHSHQVVLVVGETGSGKTTQVPQMILEDCCDKRAPCRVICTQPRRIAALSIAERVAAERGEKIGQTVGYQIRLESKVSPKTLLTFCTNGVLLRTLMGSDGALEGVTHIIVDEVHERNKFCDFLLICLHMALSRYPSLKIIAMSASLNVDLFVNYFKGCGLIRIPGRLFEVKQWFLEDILKMTGYNNSKMQKFGAAIQSEKQNHNLKEWCDRMISTAGVDKKTVSNVSACSLEDIDDVNAFLEKDDIEPWVAMEMDGLLSEVWMSGDEAIFSQIFHLLNNEKVTVDYQHSQNSVTPLMAAAARGMFDPAEQLIGLGANVNLKTVNGLTAVDLARKFEHHDLVNLLLASVDETNDEVNDIVEDAQACNEEDRQLLNAYHHSVDEDKVDTNLLLCLLQKILDRPLDGAVLVFLPGYDEIMTLKDAILSDPRSFDTQRCVLFILHSAVQSADQKKVFKKASPGVKKIILATNIAESSITIDDVVYVIDSGKVKEKSYDALASVTILKSNWISRANVLQRCGRAGRCQPGECFHMFSRVRFESMPEYQVPEILRSPLQELCLHTKRLAPAGGSIADFLSKAPEPPLSLILENAVNLLKVMDALDRFEDLTELGHHLVDLPIEPRLGKMVLCAVVLKCLDPILTIACTLAHKDPFLMPSVPSQKRAAAAIRRGFTAGTYSDHMAYLRVFHAWQKARAEGCERSFCEKNFVSAAAMEMIQGMRAQLLGQLRASGFVRARGGSDIKDLNANSENWAVVKAAITSGLYPHVVRADKETGCLLSHQGSRVRLHNSSVLSPPIGSLAKNVRHNAAAVCELPGEWMVYEEMSQAQYCASIRCATVVSNITVALFCGPARLPEDVCSELHSHSPPDEKDAILGSSESEEGNVDMRRRQKTQLTLDQLLVFTADTNIVSLVVQLRQKWNAAFLRRLRTPSKPCSPVDEHVIRALVAVLSVEEQALGLQQPSGVGQRPRPMGSSSLMDVPYQPRLQHAGQAPSNGDGSVAGEDLHVLSAKNKSGAQVEPKLAAAAGEPHGVGASAHHGATHSDQRQIVCSTCHSPVPDSAASSSSSRSHTPGLAAHPSSVSSASADFTVPCASAGLSLCRYFVMKCSNHKCLDISMNKQIWATTPANERKLNKAYQEGKTVYLIFSVQGSGHFQGFARMSGVALKEKCLLFGVSGLGGTIPIMWIKRSNLPFQQTHHLLNSWNENKKVQVSRDGQEIERLAGEALIRMWDQLPHYPPKQPSGYSRAGDGRGSAEESDLQHFSALPMSASHAPAAAAAVQFGNRDKPGSVMILQRSTS